MADMKRAVQEAALRNCGYVDTVDNRGRLDTVVLTKDSKVIRLGWDSAFDIFVSFICSQQASSLHLPHIYRHEKRDPPTPFAVSNEVYWFTEMELLEEITDSDVEEYNCWIVENEQAIARGASCDDFHELRSLLIELYAVALTNNLVPDFTKSKNLMKRKDGTFVVIDVFA